VDAIAEAARATDIDRLLAAKLAPRQYRDDLIVLAAFLGEIARIPRLVSEPQLGEIRLQWWHDEIERFGDGDGGLAALTGHPLADALGGVVARRRLSKHLLLEAVDARVFELYADPLQDEDALARYLAGTEGAGFRLTAAILGVVDLERATPVQAVLVAAGEALGLTRALLALPFHLSRGHTPFPRSWPEVQNLDLGSTAGDARRMRHLVHRVISEARSRLDVVRQARAIDTSPTYARGFVHAILPCALVEPYLQALENGDFDPARQIADIAPLQRVWRLWWSRWVGAV